MFARAIRLRDVGRLFVSLNTLIEHRFVSRRIATDNLASCRRDRHRYQAYFRRAVLCALWRLGFMQSSFDHIARIP